MLEKVEFTVRFDTKGHEGISFMFEQDQKKTFDDLPTAIAWCKKNHHKICMINDTPTYCREVSEVDLATLIMK